MSIKSRHDKHRQAMYEARQHKRELRALKLAKHGGPELHWYDSISETVTHARDTVTAAAHTVADTVRETADKVKATVVDVQVPHSVQEVREKAAEVVEEVKAKARATKAKVMATEEGLVAEAKQVLDDAKSKLTDAVGKAKTKVDSLLHSSADTDSDAAPTKKAPRKTANKSADEAHSTDTQESAPAQPEAIPAKADRADVPTDDSTS